jgi:DNA-binding transcriptional ArsR family regulator
MALENEDFPEEIVRPIKALNDESRRRIILALTKNNEFSYSEILKQFDFKKGTLTHHLHHLISSGLIRNFTKATPESRNTSYYELTDFGCRFIDGLYYTLAPKPVKRTYTYNSITVSDDYLLSGSATVAQSVLTGIPTPEILTGE